MLSMESTTSLINYDSQSLTAKTLEGHTNPSALPPVFVLCDICFWCATYFSNARIPTGNICPQCNANSNQLTSFPIAPNESFTYNYNDKRGIELGFRHRELTTMTNNRIVKLSDWVADNDKYDYAYDYNYYITEGSIVNLDN